MKNWIPKKSTLISTLVLAFLSLALYGVILFLVLNEIRKIDNYYTDTESKYSRVERSGAIKSLAEVNKQSIATLRDFFVKKGDEIKFIEEIERVGRESGVNFLISSIDVKPNQKEATFKEDVIVKINTKGSWQQIMRFLEMLNKMYFGVSVQNMSLDVDGEAGWSGAIDLVIFREK